MDRKPGHTLGFSVGGSQKMVKCIVGVCAFGLALETVHVSLGQTMAFPREAWEKATPKSQGVEAAKLEEAVAYLREHAGRDGVKQLVIVRNGRMIWSGPEADQVHGVWSVTKSFTSTVLGLLIDDGKATLDSRAQDYVRELAESYPAVTLRHLTTMTSGYYAVGDEPQGGYTHGPSRTPLMPGPRPLFSPPGSKYAYWDSAMNQFGNVLTRIAGESMEDVFRRRIAEPIGMRRDEWAWGVLGEIEGVAVNGGAGNLGKDVRISARELARLGHLFLNRGEWNGKRLISAGWVEAATSVQVPAELPWGHTASAIDGRGVYGFNWWVNGVQADGNRKWPGAPEGTYAAIGYNNNRMFVVPAWRMVIVRLGLDEESDGRIGDAALSTFLQKVGEAIVDGGGVGATRGERAPSGVGARGVVSQGKSSVSVCTGKPVAPERGESGPGGVGRRSVVREGKLSVSVCNGKPVAPERKTEVTIDGDAFLINGVPTYKGRTWQGHKIEGLLLNARLVQGIFDDLNPETRGRWAYPDTGTWDAERNTREFVAAMAEWRRHGLLAFTINLQGGSPQGYSQRQPWHNSAFAEDGSLRVDSMKRLESILDRADELGMVAIVGVFYFGQDERLADEAAVLRGLDNAVDWVLERGYRNVLLEVNNECNVRYDHAVLQPGRVHELIERVKARRRDGRRLLVSTSYGGGTVPGENVVRSADFLLMHGNGVEDPERIAGMVRSARAAPGYRPMPILFNEDDHFDFDQPHHNMSAALGEYCSWGYFDPGESNYRDGYQCPPVNWGINTDRKRAFFERVREVARER